MAKEKLTLEDEIEIGASTVIERLMEAKGFKPVASWTDYDFWVMVFKKGKDVIYVDLRVYSDRMMKAERAKKAEQNARRRKSHES